VLEVKRARKAEKTIPMAGKKKKKRITRGTLSARNKLIRKGVIRTSKRRRKTKELKYGEGAEPRCRDDTTTPTTRGSRNGKKRVKGPDREKN
jgi:RecA-family ATPase